MIKVKWINHKCCCNLISLHGEIFIWITFKRPSNLDIHNCRLLLSNGFAIHYTLNELLYFSCRFCALSSITQKEFNKLRTTNKTDNKSTNKTM